MALPYLSYATQLKLSHTCRSSPLKACICNECVGLSKLAYQLGATYQGSLRPSVNNHSMLLPTLANSRSWELSLFWDRKSVGKNEGVFKLFELQLCTQASVLRFGRRVYICASTKNLLKMLFSCFSRTSCCGPFPRLHELCTTDRRVTDAPRCTNKLNLKPTHIHWFPRRNNEIYESRIPMMRPCLP